MKRGRYFRSCWCEVFCLQRRDVKDCLVRIEMRFRILRTDKFCHVFRSDVVDEIETTIFVEVSLFVNRLDPQMNFRVVEPEMVVLEDYVLGIRSSITERKVRAATAPRPP